MLCYAVLCHAMLRYAMLRYAVLCYAMICWVMLCCVDGAGVLGLLVATSDLDCVALGETAGVKHHLVNNIYI